MKIEETDQINNIYFFKKAVAEAKVEVEVAQSYKKSTNRKSLHQRCDAQILHHLLMHLNVLVVTLDLANIAVHLEVVIALKIAVALIHAIKIHQRDRNETNPLLPIQRGKRDQQHEHHHHVRNPLNEKRRVHRQANVRHHHRHQHEINLNLGRRLWIVQLFNRQSVSHEALRLKKSGIETNVENNSLFYFD